MNKKKYLVLTLISVIAFILITIGVTYSFFSYIGLGATDNTIKAGSISFIYEETNKMGNGIKIEDALPTSDTEGKESSNYFDFKVTSSTGSTITIPYEITARVSEDSDNLSDYVKLYLTKVNGNSEQQVALSIYSDLSDSTNTLASQFGDKTLYKGEIPVGATDYTENYRLRMWLNNDINDGSVLDYSPVYACSNTTYTNQTDCESNNGVWNPIETYTNQGKTFSIRINVYANGSQASQSVIANETTTEINGIKVNNVLTTENTDSSLNYDYYIESEVVNTDAIDVLTVNSYQTYTIEEVDGTTLNTIAQISNQNFNFGYGDNYYKITVTSKNGLQNEEYILKVKGTVPTTSRLIPTILDSTPSVDSRPVSNVFDGNDTVGFYTSSNTAFMTFDFGKNVVITSYRVFMNYANGETAHDVKLYYSDSDSEFPSDEFAGFQCTGQCESGLVDLQSSKKHRYFKIVDNASSRTGYYEIYFYGYEIPTN